MSDLYCFDVDGTLETSGGPIKLEWLQKLRDRGEIIIIVSESTNAPEFFPRVIWWGTSKTNTAENRRENLKAARAVAGRIERCYYFGDSESDQIAADNSNFIFIHINDAPAFLQNHLYGL